MGNFVNRRKKLAIATLSMQWNETKIRIPEDLKSLASQWLAMAGLLNPSLTTINQPAHTNRQEWSKLNL